MASETASEAPPSRLPAPDSRYVLGMRVDGTSYADASDRVMAWAQAGESRYLCASSVNNVMEAHDDPSFREVMNGADLVTPDGMPLVWALRILGVSHATRTYGPNLTELLCERAAREGVPVAFYGGSEDVLKALQDRALERWPGLEVAYAYSPPFRPLTDQEHLGIIEAINDSGARIVFVGLGTPKQDRWMAANKGQIHAAMLGVGAAFDFIAGHKKQAPPAMQKLGLEWVFRLVTEPRRLWRRYLYHNPRFVVLFGTQVLKQKFRRSQQASARV
jgi:N-acetylglucosaminyldiphosphoundecaprenol N-acetyl-beta-D-mannosaminyltransferase